MFLFGKSSTPEPSYRVLKKTAEYEVRQYEKQLRAYVQNPENNSNNAFRTLAGYIFGGNTAKTNEGAEKIAMTAPVAMSKAPEAGKSETISMTAPVAMQGITMAFVMPDKYTSLDQLPVPKDSKVQLVEVPAAQYAVIRFNGSLWNKSWAEKHEKILRESAARDGVQLSGNHGDVQMWAYNPPFTLKFFRRNEVAIPVTKPLMEGVQAQ